MSVRPLLASTSRLATAATRRGIISPSAAAAAPSSSSSKGAAGGVDARIFSGIDGFLGAKEVQRLDEWQGGLWGRLQEEVRSNPRLAPIRLKWDNDRFDVAELLAFSAREPSLSLAFNYASLLVNNSYFLEGLNPDTPKPVPAQFAPLEDRVASYASGIIGSGWLWLVKAGEEIGDFDVVPTFAAGSLLVTARAQRGRDGALPLFGTPATSGAEAEAAAPAAEASPAAAADAPAAPRYARKKATAEVTPLAVLNLFELAYLGDKYGVFAREQYARDWFKSLDWDKVAKRNGQFGAF
ncbi:Putative 37S ribosomal protein S26B, mitochondrial [Vanrija pseudolonga]|uniref:37S ribosomal protein S26B, mitochondrial n=1 Tax=Vanrija pseudolonga TaxID=143232 RepID=A0AAF1BHJ8_9TREE|nr:Putative 37S ribosomal protein S26B, mitochondrial [Vanrija pseudolonga]